MVTQPPRPNPRPLPTVIQGSHGHGHGHVHGDHQTRVSFSSGSCSSNHASGDSCFQVSHSISSSHTSHSSHAPLPKGARPPSPQLAQHHTHHGRGPSPHHGQSSHSRPASKQTRSRSPSFTWKMDWRGVSKVVKWAVFGEQPSRELTSTTSKGRTQSPRSRSRTTGTSSHRAYYQDRASRSRPVAPKHQSKPLPSEPAQPNTDNEDRFPRQSYSSSSVNLPRDHPMHPILHSQSDAGHGLNYSDNVAGPPPLPYTSHFQASLPASTSRRVHGSISVSISFLSIIFSVSWSCIHFGPRHWLIIPAAMSTVHSVSRHCCVGFFTSLSFHSSASSRPFIMSANQLAFHRPGLAGTCRGIH